MHQLGLFSYRFRWVIIGVWLALFVAGAVVAPRVTGVLRGGGYSIGNSQSVATYNTLNHNFGWRALTFTVVFTASPHGLGRPVPGSRLLEAAANFRRKASARFGKTLQIAQPVLTADGSVAFERIYSAPQEDFGASFAAPLRAMFPGRGITAQITGSAAIFHDMEVVSDQDVQRVEIVTLPVALIVLLLIFGSIVASAVPVCMAPISVTLALAIVYFLGRTMDMSIFVLNTTSMLGLGVAIDYSLFMVNRFREELERGAGVEAAVARTVATSGRAILVSAIVVSVGFIGLALSGVDMLRSLGIGGSIVTFFSLLVALTLLPAILSLLGPRINLLPVVPRRLGKRRIWQKLAHRVMRTPVRVLAVVVAAIAVLAVPAFHLRVGIPGPEILPASVESRAGNDILERELGPANHPPVLVVVERGPRTPPSTYRAAALTVLDRVCTSRNVAGLASMPVLDSPRQLVSCSQALQRLANASPSQQAAGLRLARRQRVALVSAYLRSNAASAAAERYVSGLRRSLLVPGYRVLVGGQTAGQMDFDNYLYSRFPLVVLFVIATIYVVLLLAFRSVLLPLKAVLMNVFSILAAYGLVVFSFQDGHLSDLLGFTVIGNVDSIVPVFLFCVLFGISTDYEVFLLARVQEKYLETGNNEESVSAGLAVTGRIITSAAAVMIIVFGAFAFARLLVIKEVGLGLAVAVLVDATLIRALLVPATMRLLGRWNWWMPFRSSLFIRGDSYERRTTKHEQHTSAAE